MKVLWITNILFPEICDRLGVTAPVTGGWMKSSAQALLKSDKGMKLAVVTLYGHEYRKDVINGITYYCLPFKVYAQRGYNQAMEPYWQKVADDFCPDVVHIHGTEYPHGLAYVKGVGSWNVIVSIQGIVSRYARYEAGGIKFVQMLKCLTMKDFLLRSWPNKGAKRLARQGLFEKELIRKVSHVIGRTSWDQDHVWAINSDAEYHFCNETLRAPFYEGEEWRMDKCSRHRIFLSQAAKPIKGIHKVIEAMPLVLRSFPDAEVYVAGVNFVDASTLSRRLRMSTYGRYVANLLDKYGLKEKFHFTGMLDEWQMAEQYRMANVFVCPSSIENSPNSLGEAQLVGTPVVASYVGGVPDMVENGKTGLLYRFEEHEMLARQICRIFEDSKLASTLSAQGKIAALRRHDRHTNAIRTLEIYEEVKKKNLRMPT